MDDRREDWRKNVDDTLVSLTAAQRGTDSELEDVGGEIADLKRTLSGVEEENKAGLIERIHDLEVLTNKLKAIVLPDWTGKGGFAWRLDRLEDSREERKQSLGERLKFWGIVAAGLLLLLREIVHDIPIWKTLWSKPPIDSVQQDIVDSVQPKPRHRKRKAKVKQAEQSTEASNELPEELPTMLDDPDSGAR